MTLSPETTSQQNKQAQFQYQNEPDDECQKTIMIPYQKQLLQNDEQSKNIAELNRLYDKLNPQLKGWHKLSFVIFGIASLTGWNAILSALDFFKKQYPKGEYVDVTFYFPVPIMITNFLAAFFCLAISRKFSINCRIAYSFMTCCLTMILVTLIAVFFNTHFGFWASFIILSIQGFIDSINTSSLITLSGSLHPTLNNIYWTCTALSGLTTNILRMIALGMLGDGEYSVNTGSAFYFSIAAFVYVLASTLQILFTNSEYYHTSLRRQQIQSKIEQILKNQQENQKLQSSQKNLQEQNDSEKSIIQKETFSLRNNSLVKYIVEISQVFKYAGAIPAFIVLNYIQTFMMFPGVSVFQKTTYNLFSLTWAPVIMITIFNVGDIIGKFLGHYQIFHKRQLVYSVVIFRFIYFVLFLITARRQDLEGFQNDIFAMFNMICFAITNGFNTTALINLGPKNHKDPKVVDLINYVGGASIACGILIGTFLALIFDNQ